jgi:hypothetical protein
LDDERIEAGLARAELVIDRRLQRFLTGEDDSESEAAELVALRGLAREAFALAEGSEALEEARADLRATQTELAARDDALADTRRRLEAVSADLQTLRDSRLVRLTAPLRRVYYRTRGRG